MPELDFHQSGTVPVVFGPQGSLRVLAAASPGGVEVFDHLSAAESVHYQPTDPGRDWVKDSEIAIDSSGPLDSDRVFSPNVVKVPGGGYRMYYMGCGPGRPDKRSIGYTLSAYSEDGAAWTKRDLGGWADMD